MRPIEEGTEEGNWGVGLSGTHSNST